ncbi:uncharacterized protein LOC101687023 isoform X1 [Mustela putorius furo]|uniref:Uncharacterized protein LOC101687023 isoform X1 n=1 Tax=Mustela putorius furo TaxID=9669 RepID=A0A8U0RSX7_MUSPF|nr:uncharacterized protein LOC101687023 isoform X1 [Mustela putorius furo]
MKTSRPSEEGPFFRLQISPFFTDTCRPCTLWIQPVLLALWKFPFFLLPSPLPWIICVPESISLWEKQVQRLRSGDGLVQSHSAGWTTAHDPIRAGQRGASGRAHSDPKPVNPEFRPTSSLPGGLLWGQHDFREPQLPRPGGITAVRMRLEACRSSVEVTESRLRTSFQRSSGHPGNKQEDGGGMPRVK